MTGSFSRTLRRVTVAHGVVIAMVLMVPGWQRLFQKKPPQTIPVEFVVAAPPGTAVEPIPEPEPEPVPEPEPIPAPEPEPAPQPKPKPKPKPKKKPIEVSRTRITRGPAQPKTPALSEEEIRKLLAQGAQLGDHTSIPDADTRGFAQIRQAFYGAWVQPSRAEAGDDVAELSIGIHPDGTVKSRTLSKRSGNPVLDESVLAAARAVSAIPGLPAGFAARNPVVTISFRVE